VVDFVAIDFETANAKRCSPCALGIAVVENGEVTTKRNWIIKPHKEYLWFDEINSMIHGMTEVDIENAPEFPDIWPEISEYICEQTIIAHNATFDLSVLRHTMDLYDLPYPKLSFYCTRLISKSVWPNLSSYKLSILGAFLEIPFEHHNPTEDAKCSAEIALRACREKETKHLNDLATLVGIRKGRLTSSRYITCSSKYAKQNTPSRCGQDRLKELANDTPTNPDADPEHPFFGKKIVFTGALVSMTREQAMQKVLDVGGDPDIGVTRNTNYLVVGVQSSFWLKGGKKSKKMQKAETMAFQGYPIEVIDEAEFLEML
jgi:DNA polymerase-3 subunit epsilon